MVDTWVIPATAGIKLSNFQSYQYFSNQISFEFFNDAACTQPSSGQTGIIGIDARGSSQSRFQAVPEGEINVANAISLTWSGVTNQLQLAILNSLINTNYIRIYLFRR
jgi:hypothetical protein